MKIILGISVLLNLLLAGMFAGHVYHRWSSHPWHKVKQELSPESRNIAGRSFQKSFREMQPLGDQAKKSRAELLKVLTAEEFDGDAFDAAVAKLVDLREQMQVLKIQAMKEVAGELPFEDRVKMAERMSRMIGGGFERKVDRHRKIKAFTPERKPDTQDAPQSE